MSSTTTAWGWAQKLGMTHKLVLLAYAECADDENCASMPKEKLMELTGGSETTIARATKDLVEAGALNPVGEVIRHVEGTGSKVVQRYRLMVGRNIKMVPTLAVAES